MIEETAQATRVDAGSIWVVVSRQSACAGCSASKGCGQKKILDWLPSKTIEIEIPNPRQITVTPGQTVVLGLDEKALLNASLLLYLVPLLSMIGFVLSINFLGFSEGFQILGAILGLLIGFFFTRVIAIRELAFGSFTPRLISVQ